MKPQQLGQFSIERILESEGPYSALTALLPQVDMTRIQTHADWLTPRFVDAEKRVIMSFHSYVIKTPHHNILIDTCVGNHKERPARANWHRQDFPYLQALAQAGLQAQDIDFVCCTHLHADHVGWNTRLDGDRWVPTFTHARYVFSHAEHAHWASAHQLAITQGQPPPNHGSYADSVLPIVQAGRALMVRGEFEFEPGITLVPAPGHTPGSCVVHAHSQGHKAVFSGDILHTPAQLLDLSWSSRFCHDLQQATRTRQQLIHGLADTDTRLFAAHFPSPVAGRVVSRGQELIWQTGDL